MITIMISSCTTSILSEKIYTLHNDALYFSSQRSKVRTIGSRLAAGWNVDITDVIHAGHRWFRPVEELRLVELFELSHSHAVQTRYSAQQLVPARYSTITA